MYQYFLGALGNRRFIRPQYEITDGTLREITDRFAEFPEGGTVSISGFADEELDDIKNRLIKFRLDFKKDLSPHYQPTVENSNKYAITLQEIEDLNGDEIIELIDIDCTINEFLNDKAKRTLRIKHKPNKQILLRTSEGCFGPFEFMISDVEEVPYSDEAIYTLKINVNSGTINVYNNSDLAKYVREGLYTIRRNDRMEFIYRLDELESVQPDHNIEYFDNDELADYFEKMLAQSSNIDELSQLRDQFLQFVNSFSQDDDLSQGKIKRIAELLETSEKLSGYKIQIIEEYLKNDPNADADKQKYLSTHEEILDDIAKRDTKYDERVKKLDDIISELEKKQASINEEIAEGERQLSDQKAQIAKFEEEAVEKKRQEIEAELTDKRAELESLKQKVKEVTEQAKQQESYRDTYNNSLKELKTERANVISDINSKVVQWAAQNRNTEIINLLVSQLEISENQESSPNAKHITNLSNGLSADDIRNVVNQKLEQAKRNVSSDEIYNYLISVVQNYMVVFAGEPGTGKTSLCKLLAKSLGIFDSRFAQVPVERGWTSAKDLIGYYNPLTKEIEESQPAFSKCIRQLDAEYTDGIVEAPYFALLDEANLSPIEFYWSTFNFYFDDLSRQKVQYSNGKAYTFGDSLRFLATINYDQTTTDLSPRFIDRAWVISMSAAAMDAIIANPTDDSLIENNDVIISLSDLRSVFSWENVKDKKLNQVTKDRLERIIAKMREGGHIISARSLKAIIHYYLVAEEYMTSKEVALDFAIAQKVLPCLSGNGKKYKEFLTSLMNICKENQLNRSANIISRIIDRQEHEFYGFFSL